MPQFKVNITGTVQGVGFRPFIFRIAKYNNIRGYIKNSGNSVEILIEGKEKDINNFLDTVKDSPPPISSITNIDIKPVNENKFTDFLILKSDKTGGSDSIIPYDVATCDTCLSEIFDSKNRRHLYPFNVCTDCGPRFTIIESLPYDRENTTMSGFQICGSCKKEYFDATDRRFRAEPVCCPDCGPSYELYIGKEKTFSKNPVKAAAIALDEGKILAIKGIGGTHLCARTTDDALMRMRKILKRPNKPFAIMARNMLEVCNLVYVSKKEEELLQSRQRPIVILAKNSAAKKSIISENISPGLGNIGIMLPYSGINHLLFHYSKQPVFVMTSANVPGMPMAINNDEILSLDADLSLIHNRQIKNRCDDSVIKVVNENISFIRRSRGFVPTPLDIKGSESTVLSLGAELEVTACLLKKDKAFLTQYIGNTTKLNTLEYLSLAVNNLMELTGVKKVDAIAVDMHPLFNTAKLGLELSEKMLVPLIKCQHHFAHCASLQAESAVEKMVCITADGIGYGNDGTAWGGEIIAVDNGFERCGHLMPQIMPGGDLASKYPARMAAGILSQKYSKNELLEILDPYFSSDELVILLKQIERKINSPVTSSAGRILDVVSALLGICMERTYEGEPAMRLESCAADGKDKIDLPVMITKNKGNYILDTTEIIDAVLQAKDNYLLSDIAASAQSALAKGLCQMAIKVAEDRKIDTIGFSGGVAYNGAIVKTVSDICKCEDFNFVVHTKVPCGDGGISLGQALMGALEFKKK